MKSSKIAPILITVTALGITFILALPSLLQKLGLHPDYEGQRYLLPGGRALIVTTSHDTLGDTGANTGVFGSELTAPYYEFLDGRMTVDLASINGGRIPFDPLSFKWILKSKYDDRFLDDPVLKEKTQNSKKIDNLDFTEYDVIFLAGGWGAAYDLGFSRVLGRRISEANKAGKVIGGVCHGPLGLLLAHDERNQALVEGRRIAAVSDKQIEELGIHFTPQHPERELRAAGAKFESATAVRDIFANHIAIDGRLVTGQNQNAGPEVANLMMKLAGGTRR